MRSLAPSVGAIPVAGGVRFRVWAPHAKDVTLQLEGTRPRRCPMIAAPHGYFEMTVPGVPAGNRYWFQLDGGQLRPDPASRSQPDGVHGPSAVVDPSTFEWSSRLWRTPALDDYVIYELHVGTFTAAGTFDAAIAEIDRLRQLGLTAIELMPVSEFPGERNWGYDGSYPFAAKSSYGGPEGLARLVDACHERELAVILDVVYNHFGPEGSYVGEFGDYYSDRHHTLWGNAINFDGPGSDEVRRFFIESAVYWLRDLRIDAFRVDAIHAIFDQSAHPFLSQLTETIHGQARALGRQAYVIAESDLNDPRVLKPVEAGGFGFDAQWSDDFHHALHTALTPEREGIYFDFNGRADLKRAYERGFVYTGQHSRFRDRAHGAPLDRGTRPRQLVVCDQNHDQIGNRAIGDRLAATLNFAQLKLSIACTLLSPFIPLIFMGEEYGETAPFQFFTSHGDPGLAEAVRRGRSVEFAASHWTDEIPDPQAAETFARSKLQPEQRDSERGHALEAYVRELLRLRQALPALTEPSFVNQDVKLTGTDDQVLEICSHAHEREALLLLNFTPDVARVRLPPAASGWTLFLNADDPRWGGEQPASHAGQAISQPSIAVPPWGVLLLGTASSR